MRSTAVERAALLLKARHYLTKELTATAAEYKDEIEDEDTTDYDLPLCLRKENGQFMLTSVAFDGRGSGYDFARIDRDLMMDAVRCLLTCITKELAALGVTTE